MAVKNEMELKKQISCKSMKPEKLFTLTTANKNYINIIRVLIQGLLSYLIYIEKWKKSIF